MARKALLYLLIILLWLGACTYVTPITPTALPITPTALPITPTALPLTPAPTFTPEDSTPTPEPADWVGLPLNPGHDLQGEPLTDVMVSEGNPQVTVQHPPSWDLYGVPGVRWPAVYRRNEGTDTQYEYNLSFLSGTYGLGQWERACARCILVIRYHTALNTTQWTPGSIYFSADLWPTSGHSGVCLPTQLPQQSPPAPAEINERSAVWLITSGESDWYMRAYFVVPWPVFGDQSRLFIHSIEVREVGEGYGTTPINIRCQPS